MGERLRVLLSSKHRVSRFRCKREREREREREKVRERERHQICLRKVNRTD